MDLRAGQIITVDWRKDPNDPGLNPLPPEPNSTNGCRKVSYLLPQNLTCVAKTRITDATACCVTPTELQQLRQLVVLVIGGFS